MTPRIPPLSLRARLTAWYVLVLLAVLAVFGSIVVWQQQRIGLRRVDRELDALTETLDNVVRDELSETSDPADAAAEAQRTMSTPGRAVAILGRDGSVLAANWNGLALQTPIAAAATPRSWTAAMRQDSWRVHVTPMPAANGIGGLLVAAPLNDVLREQREAEEAMWIGIPIALLLAGAGGLWLASVGLGPITAMAARAEALAPGGMEDLGESERRDELGQLARAFNHLVARLREALRTQRQFMADASHELRTPVSVIQSTADVTLARTGRPESDYRDALDGVGTEARRLARLVEDMLVLARADAGGYPLRREHLYLNDVVSECERALGPVARERRVSIRASTAGDVPFCGDESLLRRMILNLLQNAVTHTRAGTAVGIDVAPNGRCVYVRVSDEGDGIAERDRERIFERFVQLDAARRTSGAGLGLPIARWIAEAHGGSVEVESSGSRGSVFRVTLPVTLPSSS